MSFYQNSLDYLMCQRGTLVIFIDKYLWINAFSINTGLEFISVMRFYYKESYNTKVQAFMTIIGNTSLLLLFFKIM